MTTEFFPVDPGLEVFSADFPTFSGGGGGGPEGGRTCALMSFKRSSMFTEGARISGAGAGAGAGAGGFTETFFVVGPI